MDNLKGGSTARIMVRAYIAEHQKGESTNEEANIRISQYFLNAGEAPIKAKRKLGNGDYRGNRRTY